MQNQVPYSGIITCMDTMICDKTLKRHLILQDSTFAILNYRMKNYSHKDIIMQHTLIQWNFLFCLVFEATAYNQYMGRHGRQLWGNSFASSGIAKGGPDRA